MQEELESLLQRRRASILEFTRGWASTERLRQQSTPLLPKIHSQQTLNSSPSISFRDTSVCICQRKWESLKEQTSWVQPALHATEVLLLLHFGALCAACPVAWVQGSFSMRSSFLAWHRRHSFLWQPGDYLKEPSLPEITCIFFTLAPNCLCNDSI